MNTKKADLKEGFLSQSGYLTLLKADRRKTVEIGDYLTIGRDISCNFSLEDPFVSNRHARIEPTQDGYLLKDLRSSNGVFLNGNPVLQAKLKDNDIIKIGESKLRFTFKRCQKSNELISASKNKDWNEQLKKIPLLAQTDFPILITGPSGTGKEIVARLIHQRSQRSFGPFVSINCSALSESLVESELFGHVKGSFTGATTNRKGAFQTADKGTLFLDEVGDLPLSLQPKLLRALENMEIKPVGGDQSISTDVRILTATHKTLKFEVERGSFREDLYYRLNVLNIKTPSLKHRIEDFENLLYFFGKENRVSFSTGAIKALKAYSWPGNIRELKNFVKRASAIFPKQIITEGKLETVVDIRTPQPKSEKSFKPTLPNIKKLEKEMICERLIANYGNQRKTAEDLGMPKSTLHDRIKGYNINIKELIG